ncbi:MAG: DNA/RNA non-specific endonuclease [Candidatus Kapabacteria bacterium]|nr:DNA/RNA non-specific endonuclease [Candidatus Kapabacteria bacterium]
MSKLSTPYNIFTSAAAIAVIVILYSCSDSGIIDNNNNNNNNNNKIDTNRNRNIELGIPRDADSSDDFIIYRQQYVLSYNKNLNVANWVSWYLNDSWIGSTARCDCFSRDSALSAGLYRVADNDYSGSGYDRGHICPSADRTSSKEDNRLTFKMTNMYPQTPDLNQGVWEKFEEFERSLCLDSNKEVYIISGGIFHTGYRIINGKIAVPDSCFKIIVGLPKGKRLADITTSASVYCVLMPNIAGVRKEDWHNYLTTVRRIEQSTGYNFLSDVPKTIQDYLETK